MTRWAQGSLKEGTEQSMRGKVQGKRQSALPAKEMTGKLGSLWRRGRPSPASGSHRDSAEAGNSELWRYPEKEKSLPTNGGLRLGAMCPGQIARKESA